MTLRSEHIKLYKEGFNPLTIRRWTEYNGEYHYDMLCHTFRNGDTRWERINLSNEEIESQIESYGSK